MFALRNLPPVGDILENLVDCMAEMGVAVGVGWTIMENKLLQRAKMVLAFFETSSLELLRPLNPNKRIISVCKLNTQLLGMLRRKIQFKFLKQKIGDL